jgi:hypothetical protein
MSTIRHPRPTHHGRHAKSRHDATDGAVSRLIANAAPPRDCRRELRGEQEAVAAFAKARLNPAAEPQRRLMRVGKLLALKTVIAVVGLSGGSVALAAATGNLPAHLGGHPAAAASASSTATASADARDTHHRPATPSPAVRGLCHAYTAEAGSNPGKALDNPAFSALISAAGGKGRGKVMSYCTTVLTVAPGHSASHGRGNGKGNQDASGKPAAHPTPASGTHPARNSGEGNSGSGSKPAHVSNKTKKAHTHPSPHPKGKPSPQPTVS